MLAAVSATPHRRRSSPVGGVSTETTNPAPITVAPAIKPHPVYGMTPIDREGCTLECQPIQMLNFWHQRAVDAADNYHTANPPAVDVDDAGFELLRDCVWSIYEASFKTKISGLRDIAALMEIVERHCVDNEVELALDLAKVQHLARAFAKATEPVRPTKKIGNTERGGKLTRFGVIARYQSFLIHELETIGHHIYGKREYPIRIREEDDAVNARCRSTNSRGDAPVFFAPGKLTARARAVLKSLKIDAERADPTNRRGGAR